MRNVLSSKVKFEIDLIVWKKIEKVAAVGKKTPEEVAVFLLSKRLNQPTSSRVHSRNHCANLQGA